MRTFPSVKWLTKGRMAGIRFPVGSEFFFSIRSTPTLESIHLPIQCVPAVKWQKSLAS